MDLLEVRILKLEEKVKKIENAVQAELKFVGKPTTDKEAQQ